MKNMISKERKIIKLDSEQCKTYFRTLSVCKYIVKLNIM